MSIATQQQLDDFARDGYVAVSGLVPDEIVARAETHMWDYMEVKRDDPSTWHLAKQPDHRVRGTDDPYFLALYTDRFMDALHEVARLPRGTVAKPERTMTINAFPQPDEPWRWHGPHLDHGNREFEFLPFPRAYCVATQIFLNDVEPHGGGIALWPGTPRKLADLIRSNPDRYDLLYKVQEDIDSGHIDIGTPADVTANKGDVVFYDWLMIHCGTVNNRPVPRFAVNWKFPGEQEEPEAAKRYREAMAAKLS